MSDILEHMWSHYNYLIYILLMVIGLYAVLAKGNLVKKVIGLNILQTAVFLFYLSIGKVDGGLAPIIWGGNKQHALAQAPYENPLPHVLMLTAIVVMVATLGVALAVAILIFRRYKTLEEDEIIEMMRKGA